MIAESLTVFLDIVFELLVVNKSFKVYNGVKLSSIKTRICKNFDIFESGDFFTFENTAYVFKKRLQMK